MFDDADRTSSFIEMSVRPQVVSEVELGRRPRPASELVPLRIGQRGVKRSQDFVHASRSSDLIQMKVDIESLCKQP